MEKEERMRQKILDDINFVIQNNYRAGNPQFIQETKPSLLREETPLVSDSILDEPKEEEKEKTYKFEFTADEVYTLEVGLRDAWTRAVDVKHSSASAIKKVIDKIHQNR